MAAEGLEKLTEVPVEFFKDGSAFVNKCQKPNQKEYLKIIRAVKIMDTLVMGEEEDVFPFDYHTGGLAI
ncbi:Protein transport protein, putative [Candida maltosa Xu316]|uniref:Protein transport protein, putative n=1 Tax=Candida maltosa (strain Xu316) TaxID=1245528 RepID=M3HDZ0_CANMX|nr:Protein transport protein, putative [Candida maltosa Xu316]